jgi:endonuclease/exonuclease/phosphatase family metal-dependent hydrolase
VLRVQLPWPVDPAVRSMPRMLLEAVVQAPFGPLRVMTTHLEYYSQTQRAAQLEAVRARHAEACAHALDDRARSDSGDRSRRSRRRSRRSSPATSTSAPTTRSTTA